MIPAAICPECRDGKHRNCVDLAMNIYDEMVPCDCDCDRSDR